MIAAVALLFLGTCAAGNGWIMWHDGFRLEALFAAAGALALWALACVCMGVA